MSGRKLHAYYSSGRRSRKMAEAFAHGAGCATVPVAAGYRGGDVAVYGWTRGLWEIVQAAQRNGCDWYYMDNAYIGRGEYFRVTRNARQWHGEYRAPAPVGAERLRRLGVRFAPWRRGGRYILVATQSEAWYPFACGVSRNQWLRDSTEQLRQYTSRPIVVREKPSPHEMRDVVATQRALSDGLADAWCVFTHSSGVAVDALVAGVPAIVGERCAAWPLRTPVRDVEQPRYPTQRLRWAAFLAANQWTLAEIREGVCWAALSAAAKAA